MDDLSTTLGPVSHKTSDFIEIGYLTFCFFIGAYLNLTALAFIVEQRRERSNSIVTLKLHLNLSDLMIIFVYVASELCHLVTYEWQGGDYLCPIVKFIQLVSFYISSNVIVCIALDRLLSLLYSHKYCGVYARKTVRIMIVLAWGLAFLSALPQFWVWTTINPFPEDETWTQCVTIWEDRRHWDELPSNYTYFEERLYNMSHIVIMFWIPASLVFAAYFMMVVWLARKSRLHTNSKKHGEEHNTDERRSFLGRKGRQCTSNRSKLDIEGTEMDVIVVIPPPELTSRQMTATPHTNVSRQNTGTPSDDEVKKALSKSKWTVLRMSITIVGVYIALWAPYSVLATMRLVEPKLFFSEYEHTFNFLYNFIVFNSLINPVIYGGIGCCCCYCCCEDGCFAFCCCCCRKTKVETVSPPYRFNLPGEENNNPPEQNDDSNGEAHIT